MTIPGQPRTNSYNRRPRVRLPRSVGRGNYNKASTDGRGELAGRSRGAGRAAERAHRATEGQKEPIVHRQHKPRLPTLLSLNRRRISGGPSSPTIDDVRGWQERVSPRPATDRDAALTDRHTDVEAFFDQTSPTFREAIALPFQSISKVLIYIRRARRVASRVFYIQWVQP